MTPAQEAAIVSKLDYLTDKVVKTNIAVGRLDRQRAAIAEALPKIDRLAAATGADAQAMAHEIRRVLSAALAD